MQGTATVKYTINESALMDGMWWHTRRKAAFPKMIRKALNAKKPNPRCWGSHDALVIKVCDEWFIGDVSPIFARLTPLQDYLDEMNKGIVEVRCYWPTNAVREHGSNAAIYWVTQVQGTVYDFAAFPRLLAKATLGDWSESKIPWIRKIGDTACGLEWANWCTEGNARSWSKGARLDILQKSNPTPFTTEKRVGKTLTDVTADVIKCS